MPTDFEAWSQAVCHLRRALDALRPLAREVGAEPAEGREWHDLLEHKLAPQLHDGAWLVVAVVGGTNIGKSVVFNHLAGEMASGISPLAAGTKHPVCLTPEKFADEGTLRSLFSGFNLKAWRSENDPLMESAEHLLFWRVGANVPERLLLLDTPDIDSDAEVNWQRAEHIRQSADVLVAVLTQQKYNDAAVKRFFRKAAEADKPVVVVFNQCDLTDDRDFWPRWLETFVAETGADAPLVYVVPYDRAAAKQLRLKFFDVGTDGRQSPEMPSSLREELASLRFDEIKLRTLRGALAEVIDPQRGAPRYLEEIRSASGQFGAALRTLSGASVSRVAWPALPSKVLVQEIREWWDQQRAPWSRSIHGFYRKVGESVAWPFQKAYEAVSVPRADPLETFKRDERNAIVTAVGRLLEELDRLATVGNETLRPRLEAMLAGHARAELLQRVEASHGTLPPVDDDYRAYLRGELNTWIEQNPKAARVFHWIDYAAALARPVITVSLATTGILAGADVAGGVVGDTVLTVALTSGGEAAVTSAGEGVKHAAAQLFRRLQTQYIQRRAEWLADWLDEELLGDLLHNLRQGAEAPQSAAFAEAVAAVAQLAQASNIKESASNL